MNKEKAPPPVLSSLSALYAMMDSDETLLPPWSAHDLAAMLNHLLQVPTEKEGILCCQGLTFGDVLSKPNIPRECLVAVKDYAKRAMDGHDAIPHDVAKVLYLSVIAQARACGYAPITSLSKESLIRLGRWCLAQGWVPQRFRETVRKGMDVQ